MASNWCAHGIAVGARLHICERGALREAHSNLLASVASRYAV